ncbi:2'-5' RNA ligase family protein [Microbacterium sp. p3-SID336]|uniref:2'-5' RNA ligase family protein n=1 Tax=Microbacterium sp. p3-SID336 TaxID=2916212 RepID=UPI0021A5EE02|nr:2'-5' RNA ligase family protein [Microbacterium sp. p3-SID336]MCT1476649.1 2'-5' RNA ligase family protein [Microbacterium sp. p3-SID336]
MRRPFMSTPEQLAGLDGQQYLVLRPAGPVARSYRTIQEDALARIDAPLRHPHTEHVTLRGFAEPERRDELRALIVEWAAQQEPLELVAEAVDGFPSPWQILIIRLARTPALVGAYASLSRALEPTTFRRLDELSVEEWTFHLSLLYGKTLDAAAWRRLTAREYRPLVPEPAEVVHEAEFVWYDEGVEHAEILPLGH